MMLLPFWNNPVTLPFTVFLQVMSGNIHNQRKFKICTSTWFPCFKNILNFYIQVQFNFIHPPSPKYNTKKIKLQVLGSQKARQLFLPKDCFFFSICEKNHLCHSNYHIECLLFFNSHKTVLQISFSYILLMHAQSSN